MNHKVLSFIFLGIMSGNIFPAMQVKTSAANSMNISHTSSSKQFLIGAATVGAVGLAGYYLYQSLQTNQNIVRFGRKYTEVVQAIVRDNINVLHPGIARGEILPDNAIQEIMENVKNPSMLSYVFKEDDIVKGFIVYQKNEIKHIAVHKDSRRKYIGMKLLQHAIEKRLSIEKDVTIYLDAPLHINMQNLCIRLGFRFEKIENCTTLKGTITQADYQKAIKLNKNAQHAYE